MFLISKTSCFSGKIHKILIVVVWVKSWWLFFFMAHTGVVVNSISCPPCLGVLCVYFLTSSRTGWGTAHFRALKWLTSQERDVGSTKNMDRLHILCVLWLSPFVPHCSVSDSSSSVTALKCYSASVFLLLHESLHLSLARSLFILGFTVSIPEGRSIDRNSLSMKSPLCCWRKETPLNRMLTLFLRSFWWLPLLPSIYTVSLTLCFELSEEDVREAAQTAGQGQGRVCWTISGDGYTGIITRHRNIWVMQKRQADGWRGESSERKKTKKKSKR